MPDCGISKGVQKSENIGLAPTNLSRSQDSPAGANSMVAQDDTLVIYGR